MARLIDADALWNILERKWLEKFPFESEKEKGLSSGLSYAMDAVENAPTIDPVNHGSGYPSGVSCTRDHNVGD